MRGFTFLVDRYRRVGLTILILLEIMYLLSINNTTSMKSYDLHKNENLNN